MEKYYCSHNATTSHRWHVHKSCKHMSACKNSPNNTSCDDPWYAVEVFITTELIVCYFFSANSLATTFRTKYFIIQTYIFLVYSPYSITVKTTSPIKYFPIPDSI